MATNSNRREKIDVHKAGTRYANSLAEFEQSETTGIENRALIVSFLNACQLGKTVFDREKKRISSKRLLKYLYLLRRISGWIDHKPFGTMTQSDMEAFIARVDRNALTKTVGGRAVPHHYSEWTRRDIKVTIRKFYKWLYGNGRQYPEIVSWIDTHITEETPPCLAVDEIATCVEFATTIKGKALIWTLFETGARAEEFLNVRVGDVTDRETRLVVRIEHPKTFKRSLPVYNGYRHLKAWMAAHPAKDDPDAQLFPMSYGGLAKFIRCVGRRALGKPVHPHLMRHSFATWMASKKVGRYQMCKCLGWSMSSDMPDRYIDRTGVVEDEAIMSVRGDELSKTERENTELRSTLKRLEAQFSEVQEELAKRRQLDGVLDKIIDDFQPLR